MINKDVWKAHRESIIAMEGVILLNANNDHLVVQVFLLNDLQVSTLVGFILCFQIMSKHFKMYIMVTDIVGEKRISGELRHGYFAILRKNGISCP